MKKVFFKLSFICGHERSTRNEYSQAESRVANRWESAHCNECNKVQHVVAMEALPQVQAELELV